jgi:hypothetical protein
MPVFIKHGEFIQYILKYILDDLSLSTYIMCLRFFGNVLVESIIIFYTNI